MNKSIGKRIASGLALAVSFSLLALSPVSAGTTRVVRSYEMHCSEFMRSPRQYAHAMNIKFVEQNWTRYIYGNTCYTAYSGPEMITTVLLKDEVGVDSTCTCGSDEKNVAQYGAVFQPSNEFKIYTANSLKGRFVNGPAPVVKWTDIEDYIRRTGESQGISYWAGEFWTRNNARRDRPNLHYAGPSRKWIVPDGFIVIKKHGKQITAGYEVRGTNYVIQSDWYFKG